MPRRKKIYRKEEKVDSLYGSALVHRLTSKIMRDGKRALAERIVSRAIELSNEGQDTIVPLEILTRAVENAKPHIEVKSRRVGGATYQVPTPIDDKRAESLAFRWLIQFARNRKGVSMSIALANEIKDAASNQGAAVRKRDDTHKMAQANRAFSHFRW